MNISPGRKVAQDAVVKASTAVVRVRSELLGPDNRSTPDFLERTWGAVSALDVAQQASDSSFWETALPGALAAVQDRFEDGLAGLVRDHYLAKSPIVMGREQQKAHNLAEQKAAEARRLFRKYLLTE